MWVTFIILVRFVSSVDKRFTYTSTKWMLFSWVLTSIIDFWFLDQDEIGLILKFPTLRKLVLEGQMELPELIKNTNITWVLSILLIIPLPHIINISVALNLSNSICISNITDQNLGMLLVLTLILRVSYWVRNLFF